MAVGYAYQGICYETQNLAFLAFKKNFGYDGQFHVTSLTSSSLAGNVITYNISAKSLDNTTATASRTGTFTLQPCDYSFFQTPDIPDLLVISVLFFAAMIGFGQGFRP